MNRYLWLVAKWSDYWFSLGRPELRLVHINFVLNYATQREKGTHTDRKIWKLHVEPELEASYREYLRSRSTPFGDYLIVQSN